jgi:ribose transport system permease protein
MSAGPATGSGLARRNRPPDETASRSRRLSGQGHLARFSGVYVFAVFIIVYGAWVPHTFLTITTVHSILGDQAITGIVTIGVVIELSAGVFDLSFANNLGLAGVICGWLMFNDHLSPPLAIAIALLAGLLVGAVNAFFIVKVGVSSIVATLAMSSILLAINEWLTNGGQFLSGFPTSFTRLATPRPLGIPILAVYFAVVALLGWYLLEHTPVGRRLQATGAGPDAARLAGVNTGRMTFIALVVAGGLSSLAGVLVTAQVNESTPDIGSGYLLAVVAAAFLGTTQIKPGRFNIGGTVLAIFLLATGVQGLQLAGGGQEWITDAFNGVALIVAVSFAALSQRSTGVVLSRLRLSRRRAEVDAASVVSDATPTGPP